MRYYLVFKKILKTDVNMIAKIFSLSLNFLFVSWLTIEQ